MSQSDAGKTDAEREGRNYPNYDKNFQRMLGICFDCSHYLGNDCPVSEHCDLEKCSCPEWGER